MWSANLGKERITTDTRPIIQNVCVCVGGVVCFVLFAKNISLYTVYLEKELLSMGDIWLNDKTGK